jgi:acetyl-CoA acetyltransferase
MVTARNPIKDKVAFAGVATTGFRRDGGDVTEGALALRACIDAVCDAGLRAQDIDGICGSQPHPAYVQSALGIPEVTWFAQLDIPFAAQVMAAMNAVYSGSCDTVLAYHGVYRNAFNSRAAANDPFRRLSPALVAAMAGAAPMPESIAGAAGYASWASRYLHDHPKASRETFGYIALNSRANAAHNPGAAKREPMTMDDYLSARMVRWPLCLLDMDLPVDGADAFVITTAERARDLDPKPVLIHAATFGAVDRNEEDQMPSLDRSGQQIAVAALRAKSDIWLDDIDVYFPYDGFTTIAVNWLESTGWCDPGEATEFIRDNWDDAGGRMLINGSVPVNPHGGALSEGGTQGSGHVREAILQLRGEAGERQVPGATKALVTPGGFFFNAQGMVLRTDGA